MKVVFAPEASAELEEGRDWYNSQLDGLGDSLVDHVMAMVDRIAEGSMHFQKFARTRARRAVMGRFPYNVVYYVMTDCIRVVAIAPHRRHPHYWRRRK